MKSIVNIKDRLEIIKTLFEICIESKVCPQNIFIYTTYQKWNRTTDFDSECRMLSFENPLHRKTIDLILTSCDEIIKRFEDLKPFFEADKKYNYHIECTPVKTTFEQLDLIRTKPGIEGAEKYQFINGSWYKLTREELEYQLQKAPKFVGTSPEYLFIFAISIKKYLNEEIQIAAPSKMSAGTLKVMSIPTKATSEEILDFWLKLTGNNEKGEPYWESEKEIEHFVFQNFEAFPGVDEIKSFNPNLNKSELNHITWTFMDKYGMSKTKMQYVKLLMNNFKKFEGDQNVYSNIKDYSNKHLNKLLK